MSTFTPYQRALLDFTRKQIEKYESGAYSLRTNKNVLPNSNFISNVENINTRTFVTNDGKVLLSVTIDKNNKTYAINSANYEFALDDNELDIELANLVTLKLKSHNYNQNVSNGLFNTFDERKVLVYVFLKYPRILSNFHGQRFFNGLANSDTFFDRELSVQEGRQYLIKTFGKGGLNWYSAFTNKPLNDIGNLILSDYLQPTRFSGGRSKTTAKSNHTQLKRCAEKIVVKGQERQVYVGPRGGKYIRMQNKTISLAQLKK